MRPKFILCLAVVLAGCASSPVLTKVGDALQQTRTYVVRVDDAEVKTAQARALLCAQAPSSGPVATVCADALKALDDAAIASAVAHIGVNAAIAAYNDVNNAARAADADAGAP